MNCSALAGGVTAVTALLAPLLGSFAAGLLAPLPMVSGSVAVIEYAHGGPAAAAQFLRGVLGGLIGRAAFCAAFALVASRWGVSAAFGAGCATAAVAGCLVARAMAWQDRATSARRGRRVASVT